jgi:hypothetical protein
MLTYKPDEHAETTSVAPLLQFFELVHIGDTIQSMVQVYFDKELTAYVDKTDFLNTVMREKKRFEGILDDAVAGGLNAGIEVLMNQVGAAHSVARGRTHAAGGAHHHRQDRSEGVLPHRGRTYGSRPNAGMPGRD